MALSREEITGHGEEAEMMIEDQHNLVEEIFEHGDRDKEDESVQAAKQKIKVKLVLGKGSIKNAKLEGCLAHSHFFL